MDARFSALAPAICTLVRLMWIFRSCCCAGASPVVENPKPSKAFRRSLRIMTFAEVDASLPRWSTARVRRGPSSRATEPTERNSRGESSGGHRAGLVPIGSEVEKTDRVG